MKTYLKNNWHVDKPDESYHNGVLNSMSYTEFLRYYSLVTKPEEVDWQPIELMDDVLEKKFLKEIYLHQMSKIPQMPSVLCVFTPNKNKEYELYAHHLLT